MHLMADAALDQDLQSLPSSLRGLAQRGTARSYRKGVLLIEEGSLGDNLFVIVAGQLRAYSSDARGREITYGVYGPGEYVGEMSLDGGPRSASVMALLPTVCSMVTRTTLLAHLAEHPDFALELLSKVIRRARAATLSTKQLALNDVYGRLRLLVEESTADGAQMEFTHQAIAQRLGCSREMVSKLVKDLEQGGYLSRIANGCYQRLKPLPARW
jgi:CRP/FNR family cyclic AMP-dependent transcriptional regulator